MSKNTLQVWLLVGFAGCFTQRQRSSTHNRHYKNIKELVQATYLFVVGRLQFHKNTLPPAN
ncbi:hypothetical protein [Fodinibius sp.]|uniref:hypothetical protein n=1 Tax=Fodinibius sp. TaxID=1872440 RepID=UPI002ACE37B4|nr:hypothetical protein [Fodinibius sp.]MDZ7658553.1 hypothetical protein [Fodinibius sp.]